MTVRVVHVASGREWRGGQKQVWLLARGLQESGPLDQVVVTTGGSELDRRLSSSGIPVSPARWRAALDPRALVATIAEAGRSPGRTVLHAHDAHALVIAGLAARWTGARLVVTRRVDIHLRRHGFWTRADRIIAISAAVRDVLLSDGIPAGRICVIHDGIAIEEIRAAQPLGIRRRLGLTDATPIAVNVAALVDVKDQATLIEAAATARTQHPDLHWVIAGEGILRPALEGQIAGLGLGDRVHLIGFEPEPIRLIADSSLLVHSSRHEGLGTTILDAMALGVPVVATAAGGIPELLEGGRGVLVPVGNPRALAEGVTRLLDDRSLRENCVAHAARDVLRFSHRGMAEAVRTVYRSLIPGP
jgi:glycosyltransferase involved in cell wall biosynthesis